MPKSDFKKLYEILEININQLRKIESNFRKSANRPYTIKTLQFKKKESGDIVKNTFEVIKLISKKYQINELLKTQLKEKIYWTKHFKQKINSFIEVQGKIIGIDDNNEIYIDLNEFFIEEEGTMAQFNFETALKLPTLSEVGIESTRDFLSCIEAHHAILNDAGKNSLIDFTIKTKLLGQAKTKIGESTANTFDELKTLVVSKCGEGESFDTLENNLKFAKQRQKSNLLGR
jgi:hypothetical protein